MKHNPREVREDLKDLIQPDRPAAQNRTIRAAIDTIATMQADLRRLGMTEYNEGDDE